MTAETTQGGGQSAEVVALVEALQPVIATVRALDGMYGFDDDKRVDVRHFGPPDNYNDWPTFTWGDLRKVADALPALIQAAHPHNAALSEAVGALEAIRHMSSPAKRIDEPRLRLDAVNDLAASTLSRLKSSTGGGE